MTKTACKTTARCITGLEFSDAELAKLINLAITLKQDRLRYQHALSGKHLAMLFEKQSFRTRSSFTIAMRELGGDVIESNNLFSKYENPEDQVRVLNGYVHGIMIRTFDDQKFDKMLDYAEVPIINGLSDLHHPCQTMADLLSLKERFGDLEGLTLCYLGDGNNILHSLLLLAPKLGVKVHYACPTAYGPNSFIKVTADTLYPGMCKAFATPESAVAGSNAVYTDVWSSMGADQRDEEAFVGFQVNKDLMDKANKNAVFMHCMPMERGKEVSQFLPDTACSVVFDQAQNRLHAQKALLLTLLGGTDYE